MSEKIDARFSDETLITAFLEPKRFDARSRGSFTTL
jgi:hypothetical protein